jgi:cellulose biosynthesis protein BcsQ
MLSYTVYNRAGGQSKSVLTRDLAAAHAEQGQKVLIIDLDAQKGSVSSFYDLDYDKNDGNSDRLTLHIIDRPAGEFSDLIHNAEPGVDIVPRHEELNDLGEILDDKEAIESRGIEGNEFDRYTELFRVLKENGIPEEYDVLICDPNAKADDAYYSALYATRNVLIPAATTPKGVASIDDVFDTASNFADAKNINIGNLGVVATQANLQKGTQKEVAEELRDDHDAICYFKELSIYDDTDYAQESLFPHIKNLDRVRKSQADVLPKYRTLLSHIQNKVGSPLPASKVDEYEFWTGDDYWGDVSVPVANENEVEAK